MGALSLNLALILSNITIAFSLIMLSSFTVKPGLHINKISYKAWNGTLEEDIIAKQDMFAAYLGLIILANNWK